MPMTTLSRLLVDVSYMKRSHTIVIAFDGTRRDVIGEIELAIQIGPTTFNIEFQVMDITPSYNCLLGRLWIHVARAVSSTLHQKIKFIVDGHLICVAAEEDMIMATTSPASYVEVKENAEECSFRSLEFVNATFIGEGQKILVPHLSRATRSGLMQVMGKGVRVGKGLGKKLQGKVRLIVVK